MNKLIIDTATNLLFVGLIKGDNHFFKTRVGKNDNGAFLVEYINLLLSEHSLTIDLIDEIIVGVGPGSYTGIRVSVVVAKTLSYSKNITLKQISSLKLLSSGYESVYALIDARRNHYFALKHEKGKTLIDDHYISDSDLKEETVILTPDSIKVNLNIVNKESSLVSDVILLEPNYLRKTEAEVNYDKNNGN